jgi:acetyl esterase/lipase
MAERRDLEVEERERFLALSDRVYALYGEGRLAEALALVEGSEPKVPGWRSRTVYWKACLLSALGRPAEAMAALRKGLEAGLWWRPDWLTTDHDLEPLWDEAGYGEIIEESERRQLAANASRPERPEVLLFAPQAPPRGLVVALHMYGVTAAESAPYWRPATELGFALALPESTRIQAEGRPCWDDDDAAPGAVGAAVEEARVRYPFEGPVILGGASQGGMRAVEMALRGKPVEARAFIGVVAAVADPDLMEDTARDAADRGVRGWLITGDSDAARQGVELLHAQLSAAGVECRLDVIPGLGHTFPGDFGRHLADVLPWLLES